MKIYRSPLILDHFYLLHQHYQLVEPDQQAEDNVRALFDEYNLDIDFAFQQLNEDSYQVFTKVAVNRVEKPFYGYTLFMEGVSIFSFDRTIELTDQDRLNLLHFSGLNICIGNMRNMLAATTAYGPFGRYILPSIDIKRLVDDKHTQIAEKQQPN